MDLFEALVILSISLVAHLIVTTGALVITLVVAQYGTRKTLQKAEAIEARIQKQIEKMNREITIEDKLYGAMDEFMKEQKQVLSGFKGFIEKSMDEKIDQAEKKYQASAGGKPDSLDKVLMVASQFIPQG